jgi:hypothetical protein
MKLKIIIDYEEEERESEIFILASNERPRIDDTVFIEGLGYRVYTTTYNFDDNVYEVYVQ